MKVSGKFLRVFFIFLIINQKALFLGNSILNRVKIQNLESSQSFFSNSNSQLDFNELLNAKTTKDFVKKAVGQQNWENLEKILDPLGNKWKNKILSTIDQLPQKFDDEYFKKFKIADIDIMTNQMKKLKSVLQFKMEQIDKPSSNQIQQPFKQEVSPLIMERVLDELETKFGFNFDKIPKIDFKTLFQSALNNTISNYLISHKIMNNEIQKLDRNPEEFDQFVNQLFRQKLFPDAPQNSQNFNNYQQTHPRFIQQKIFDLSKFLDERFIIPDINPDEDLPQPNTAQSDTPCYNVISCKFYAIISEKCTFLRVIVRMIYEIVCAFENQFGVIMMGLCICSPKKSPPYFIDQDTMSCNNISGWPGLVCVTPFTTYVSTYSIIYSIWQIMLLLDNLCKVPIGSLEIGSPP